jgi:hypothetical protein
MRQPFDVLHDDEVDPLGLADVVEHDDAGMVERAGCASFLLKASPSLGVRDRVGMKNLERDAAADPDVRRQVHHAHSTLAELLLDAIATESAPDHARDSAPA